MRDMNGSWSNLQKIPKIKEPDTYDEPFSPFHHHNLEHNGQRIM